MWWHPCGHHEDAATILKCHDGLILIGPALQHSYLHPTLLSSAETATGSSQGHEDASPLVGLQDTVKLFGSCLSGMTVRWGGLMLTSQVTGAVKNGIPATYVHHQVFIDSLMLFLYYFNPGFVLLLYHSHRSDAHVMLNFVSVLRGGKSVCKTRKLHENKGIGV